MASNINLLIKEYKPNPFVVTTSKLIKKLSVIFLIIFIISLVLLGSLFFVYFQKTKTSLATQQDLNRQIRAMQSTEQRIVLVKDRLNIIEGIYKEKNANDGLAIVRDISGFITEGLVVKEIDFSSKTYEVVVGADNLANLTRFMFDLTSSGKFTAISLVEMEFDQNKGFSVKLSLKK